MSTIHTVNPLEFRQGIMAGKRRECAFVVQYYSTAPSSVSWSLRRLIVRQYLNEGPGRDVSALRLFSPADKATIDHLAQSIFASLAVCCSTWLFPDRTVVILVSIGFFFSELGCWQLELQIHVLRVQQDFTGIGWF